MGKAREKVVQVALRVPRHEQLSELSAKERRSIRTMLDILLGEALAARRRGVAREAE
jgi:hypothetical protein